MSLPHLQQFTTRTCHVVYESYKSFGAHWGSFMFAADFTETYVVLWFHKPFFFFDFTQHIWGCYQRHYHQQTNRNLIIIVVGTSVVNIMKTTPKHSYSRVCSCVCCEWKQYSSSSSLSYIVQFFFLYVAEGLK